MARAEFDALFAPAPALYTIPAGAPFLPSLAAPILDACQGRLEALPDLTIFLPNRRACLTLAAVFTELAQARGMTGSLLPRMRALGDVSEEDLLFDIAADPAALDLPPAVPAGVRRAHIANLLRKEKSAGDLTWPAALRVADELGGLLDSFALENVPLNALDSLVPEEVLAEAAAHWEKSLTVLNIIRQRWPDLCAAKGWMDASLRQRALMDQLTDRLCQREQGAPMIVAGSLGSVRSTARLMAEVATRPNGLVIFPGFLPDPDERVWPKIGENHPFFLVKDRLQRDFPGVDVASIRPWPLEKRTDEASQSQSQRQTILELSLRPADTTDDWVSNLESWSRDDLLGATEGLKLINARTDDEEASLLSLIIRHALEDPQRTVMVVTPDRQLARRIEGKLRGWDIVLDDTGGIPLGGTYRGTFFRLLANWLEAPQDPLALIALLGHGLVRIGMTQPDWQDTLRWIDHRLRGPERDESLAARHARWRAALKDRPSVTRTLDMLDAAIEQFGKALSVKDQLLLIVGIAEDLAMTDDQKGADRLWRFEDGEALADHLSMLLGTEVWADTKAESDGWGEFVETLLGQTVVRKRGGHPRISLYGVLEARLQTADLIIVAGLTEGVWPDLGGADSFLSRQMREKLGLPTAERAIGRLAHDFLMAASAAEVVLSWSERRGGDPVAPSRWLQRLERLLSQEDIFRLRDETAKWRAYDTCRSLPQQMVPARPPAPMPPRAARPRTLSITDIERLLRDPYSIFARRILGLRRLDPIGMPLTVADRGRLLHRAAETFASAFPRQLPEGIEEHFLDHLLGAFAADAVPERYNVLWHTTSARAAMRFALYEQMVRKEGRPLAIEEAGRWDFSVGDEGFALEGRVDRIDAQAEGNAGIVDFKSGQRSPTLAQMRTFSPQLLLTAMMVEAGAFPSAKEKRVESLLYLNLGEKDAGADIFGKKTSVSGADLRKEMESAHQRFLERLTAYLDPDTPFLSQPRPFYQFDYGDYDHLARRGEWGTLGGGDD